MFPIDPPLDALPSCPSSTRWSIENLPSLRIYHTAKGYRRIRACRERDAESSSAIDGVEQGEDVR
jgi:hypothetical protein